VNPNRPVPGNRPRPPRRTAVGAASRYCAMIASNTRTVFWVVCGIYVALLCRLVWLQGVVPHRFAGQTAVSSLRVRTVASERGRILDRDMRILVRNEPGFTVVVDPNAWFEDNRLQGDGPEDRRSRALSGLAALLPEAEVLSAVPDMAQLDHQRRVARDKGARRIRTIDLVRWISPSEAQQIRSAALPGVGLHPTTRRRAIDGTHASALIGYVNEYGEGMHGMEHRWQSTLAGTPGCIRCRADLKGLVPGTEEVVAKGIPGKDLVLTIDSVLQHEIEQELERTVAEREAEAGAVVVVDVRTGDILAAASAPSFDLHDPLAVAAGSRNNLISQMVYEPGSTFKTFTLAGALEEGIVSESTTFDCKGKWVVGRRKVRCKPHGQFQNGHGRQDLCGVLTHSCNVASALIADKMGGSRMERNLTAFGFGRPTQSGMPGEESGLVPNEWSRIRTANVGFGQGIAVTPIQLVAAYAAFADGRYRTPRIVSAVHDPATGRRTPMPASEPLSVVSAQTAKSIRAMLQSVVENGTGTPAGLPQYAIGGKTGTAQIAEGRTYGNRFFASFVGLAPIDEPRFAILAAIKAPRGEHWGGSVAGPVFRFAAERALNRFDVRPTRLPKTAGKIQIAAAQP